MTTTIKNQTALHRNTEWCQRLCSKKTLTLKGLQQADNIDKVDQLIVDCVTDPKKQGGLGAAMYKQLLLKRCKFLLEKSDCPDVIQRVQADLRNTKGNAMHEAEMKYLFGLCCQKKGHFSAAYHIACKGLSDAQGFDEDESISAAMPIKTSDEVIEKLQKLKADTEQHKHSTDPRPEVTKAFTPDFMCPSPQEDQGKQRFMPGLLRHETDLNMDIVYPMHYSGRNLSRVQLGFELWANTVLAVGQTSVRVPQPSDVPYCHHCLKHITCCLRPCYGCIKAIYCSDDCRTKADIYHK